MYSLAAYAKLVRAVNSARNEELLGQLLSKNDNEYAVLLPYVLLPGQII
jgi:hypothetical protein